MHQRPALQYFAELPYRLSQASVIRDAGPERLGDVEYQRVFVTWNDTQPRSEFDQYLAYIHPETRRIDKVHFTVREQFRFVTGTMHFADFREVDGLVFPFRQTLTETPDDDVTDFLHEITVKEVRFGRVDRHALQPAGGEFGDPSSGKERRASR